MTTADFERRAREFLRVNNLASFEQAKGYCQRFANQFFAAVTGQPYIKSAPSAKAAYQALKQHEAKGELRPGDILFWTDGQFGHVAIHIGGGRIIENTSSARGEKLAGAIRSGTTIRSGYHIVRMPWVTEAQAGPTRVIVQGKPVDIPLELRDNTHWVPMAAFADALGWKVTDHRHDTGKLECYPKEAQ